MIGGLPLAAYLRPKNLSEVVGQTHLLQDSGWLVQAIKNDRVSSLIFWGPPGSGKTTLASLIAQETKADFVQLSATESGVKDLKQIIEKARSGKRLGVKTILFIDEKGFNFSLKRIKAIEKKGLEVSEIIVFYFIVNNIIGCSKINIPFDVIARIVCFNFTNL